jgi:hypothetical protein
MNPTSGAHTAVSCVLGALPGLWPHRRCGPWVSYARDVDGGSLRQACGPPADTRSRFHTATATTLKNYVSKRGQTGDSRMSGYK